MKKLFVLSIFLLSIANIFSQNTLVFNEVQQSNLDFYDDALEFPDGWVELYNPTDDSISIIGYGLSLILDYKDAYIIDSTNYMYPKETEWYVPRAEKVAPGEFILIYLDEEGGGLHTTFKLDVEEEKTLYLFGPDKKLVDKVMVPKMVVPGLSYGKENETSNIWHYQYEPTPNAANNSSKKPLPIAPEVEFSISGGIFYDKTFNLELTTTRVDFDYPIYYTLDGTEPTIEDSLYKEPLIVDSTMVLRAKVIHENYLPRPSNVQSYIFPDHEITLPIVSLVCDERVFFDDTIGIYIRGERESYYESFASSESQILGPLPQYFSNRNRPLNIEYYPLDELQAINQLVDMRIMGNGSRWEDKKSIAITAKKKYIKNRLDYPIFTEKPHLNSFKTITLRNSGNDYKSTFLRDATVQHLLGGKVDVDYQAYEPSVVYLNGKYFGIFNIRERSNERFVESNYNIEDFDFVESWNKCDRGSNVDLVNFINAIKSGEDVNIKDEFDYISLLYFTTLLVYPIDIDTYYNNIVLWRDSKNNKKWRFIVKDKDYTTYFRSDIYPERERLSITYKYHPLFEAVYTDKRYCDDFINIYTLCLGTHYNPENSVAVLDSFQNRIADEMVYHRKVNTQYWGDWNESVDSIRTFFNIRYHYAYTELKDFYNLGEIKLLQVGTELENTQLNMFGQPIYQNKYNGKCFAGRPMLLESDNMSSSWKVSYTNLLTGEQECFIQPNNVYNLVVSENWDNVLCENINENVGIEEVLSVALVDYSDGILTIKSNSEIKNISIYNISGLEVYSQSDINSNEFSDAISLDNVSILKIETTEKISVLKLKTLSR